MKVLTGIIVGIFIIWFLTSFYFGIITPPNEGDSLNIHIFAAEKILNGTIFSLDYSKDLFYPSSTELLLAFFISLKIPLGLFGVFSVGALFTGSYLLGKELFNDKNYAAVFATSVALLHGIIRWSLTQKPDILMTASLAFTLWIMLKKKREILDYLLLGLFCAVFVGAKFNGPIYLLVILIPFYKVFVKEFSIKKTIYFLIPFLTIGCSWYIRNIIVTGDPFYFPDYSNIVSEGSLFNYTLRAYIFQPVAMANAYLSEFMLWSLGITLVPLYIFIKRKEIKDNTNLLIAKLFTSAFIILLISFAFPYRAFYYQLVGTMRYTLPMIFLIMICVFLIAKRYGHEKLIALISIPMIIVSQMQDYHPKIIIPIVGLIVVWYFRKSLVNKLLYARRIGR